MAYTFTPKQNFAKAYGSNVRISAKDAEVVCKVIRKKPLTRAKRLLEDLRDKKRSLRGLYYSNAVEEILNLVNSCEKNADFKNLNKERLMVHASATFGSNLRRRRRKGSFGTRMKTANVEVFLIESGKAKETNTEKKEVKTETKKSEHVKKEVVKTEKDVEKK